jgi:hypothetical protein
VLYAAILWVASAVVIIRAARRVRQYPDAARTGRFAFAFLYLVAGAGSRRDAGRVSRIRACRGRTGRSAAGRRRLTAGDSEFGTRRSVRGAAASCRRDRDR